MQSTNGSETQTSEHESPADSAPEKESSPDKIWLPDLGGKVILETLGLVGIAVYGSVRFADTAFYARLGTTPDSVGITYAETLSRVAGPVALLFAIILTLYLSRRLLRARGTLTRFLVFWIAFAVTVAVSGVLLPVFPRFRWFGLNWIPISLAIAVIVFAGERATKQRRGIREHLRPGTPWFWVAIGMSLLVVFGLAGLSGYREAGYLINGDPYSARSPLPCGCSAPFNHDISLPWLSGSEGFYGIEALPVTIQWTGPGSAPKNLPTTAFYLGESDGVDVLFEPADEAGANPVSLSVPADSVVLAARSMTTPFNEN
jgi:hypothetical protein